MVASVFASLGDGSSLSLNFLTDVLDPRITFTRASSATRVNSAGLIETVADNAPRFDHDPVTLQPRGLLIEGQRTNLLLNSLLNGTSLATQSPTVTAAAHTLSFYGTGSVALSGAFTGSLAGTGALNRVSLTFTPTAGALTLTVTGQVRWANLEVGAFASSFIPTGASQATRASDIAQMTGTNFSSWYNQAEGTFLVEASTAKAPAISAFCFAAVVSDGTQNERLQFVFGTPSLSADVFDNNVQQAAFAENYGSANQFSKAALACRPNDFAASFNGAAAVTDNSGTLPTVNRLTLGSNWLTNAFHLFGHIRSIRYWPTRLTNAQLQTITT